MKKKRKNPALTLTRPELERIATDILVITALEGLTVKEKQYVAIQIVDWKNRNRTGTAGPSPETGTVDKLDL